MNPAIATDVARCARQRFQNALEGWYRHPDANSPEAQRLDRLQARELTTVAAFEPRPAVVPFGICMGDPVLEDEPPVQFTNGLTEDYASTAEDTAHLHKLYQEAGIPYTVKWGPILRRCYGHKPETFNDPADTWLEDEWTDNAPLQWIQR